jgi:NADH-quinone oxidoreductase subunit N
VPKLAGLVAIQSVLLVAFAPLRAVWLPLVGVLAAASIVFGNLGALRQSSFRRMLGYSGIAQVGYALVALTGPAHTTAALPVFAATYALGAGGAFLIAEAAGEGSVWDGSIAQLAGLGRRRPALAAALTVCLLSLTGIPLTAGFVGKFLAFGAAVAGGYVWLAVLGVIGSVVSFGYYGSVLRAVYLDDIAETPEAASAAVQAQGDELDGGVGELLPRSVGAKAAGEVPQEGPAWPAVVLALCVVAAGVAPLFSGSSPF